MKLQLSIIDYSILWNESINFKILFDLFSNDLFINLWLFQIIIGNKQ